MKDNLEKKIEENKRKNGYEFFKKKGKITGEDLEWVKESWYDNFSVLRTLSEPLSHHNTNGISFIDTSHLITKEEVGNWIDFLNQNKLTQWILENFNYWFLENTMKGTKFTEEQKFIKRENLNGMFTSMHISYTLVKLFELELKKTLFPLTITWESWLHKIMNDIPSFKDIDENNGNLYMNKKLINGSDDDLSFENERRAIAIHRYIRIKNEKAFIKFKNENRKKFDILLEKERKIKFSQNKLDLLLWKMKIIENDLKDQGLEVGNVTNEGKVQNKEMIKLRNFVSHSDGTILNLYFDLDEDSEKIIRSLIRCISKNDFESILKIFISDNLEMLESNHDSEILFKLFIEKFKNKIFSMERLDDNE